jgi:muramoyltetrapeptide carboxypeptidase
MLDRGDDVDAEAMNHLFAQLMGNAAVPLALRGRAVAGGQATGRIVGGSLTLLAASLGSPWELDTRGAILLIEDVGERPYRVDRMLQQLRAAGKFEKLAAVGIGSFGSCLDERYPKPSVYTVIEDTLRPLGIPVVTELPFGHVKQNYAWPMGGRATIDGTSGELQLLEQGVCNS